MRGMNAADGTRERVPSEKVVGSDADDRHAQSRASEEVGDVEYGTHW